MDTPLRVFKPAINPADVGLLARLINSEAGEFSAAEQLAVAWVIRNRMRRHPTDRVHDVIAPNKFETHMPATGATTDIARQVQAADPSADPTHGATHYYSPVEMPEEGESTAGNDVKGGLETTPGLKRKNYRPGYAATYEAVGAAGVQEKYLKLYKQPGDGRVT